MNTPIALITGGSRGLGKSAALHLAKAGYDIILTYNTQQEEALKVVADIEAYQQKAVALQLNVGNSHTFSQFSETIKKTLSTTWHQTQFNVLINNAGMGIHAPIEQTTEEQFDTLMNVHLKGVFFLTQKLLPLISDSGQIINFSSGLSRFSMPGYSAYAMMKGGIEVFTRYLAKELGSRKIRVNTIAPGAIETDFGEGTVRDNAQVNQMIASSTALGRVGLPEDIGGAVASLVSEHSRWINGQRLEVTGGIFL